MKATIVGAIVVAVIVTGIAYFLRDSGEPTGETVESTPTSASEQAAVRRTSTSTGTVSQPARAASAAALADPRLAALEVSPDNGFIEFVVGADGKVIQENDKDPSSPTFRRPLREYMYSGNDVIGLTSYHYEGDQVQITRTAVSYKPDGSIDQYRESTSYEPLQGLPQGVR